MTTAAAIQFNDLPMLATPKQAAAVMGPTEAQVRALVRDGRIAHVQVEPPISRQSRRVLSALRST